MFVGGRSYISEEFEAELVTPEQMDELLERGWRHFGTKFYRYNFGFYGLDIRVVIPLRIRLADFSLSKSQRRTLKRNADLRTVIRPAAVTDESERLFERHKARFDHSVPESIYDFLSRQPATSPVEACELAVYESEQLVAVSYFDVSARSVSGQYAIFEPAECRRGLGIFTMLKEIEYAADHTKEFYYQGYSYEGNSFYDYKKRFRGTEGLDWGRGWETLGTA